MGMAASQARLLQLTSRKNDIGYELTRLSNDKVSLSREMQKVSRKYQDSLNQKVLKWSNNNGVSYIDLSYNNLMKPSTMNQNKPYLLTDQNDKIVIDSEYKKYAEMISPNGSTGGNWESVRTQVLAELTGIDATKIASADSYQEEIWADEAVINQLIEEEPILPKEETHIEDFIANIGNSTGISASFSDGDDWKSAYNKNGTIDLGDATVASANLKAITDHIATQLGQFIDDPDVLKSACETFYNEQVGIINNADKMEDSLKNDATPLNLKKNNFSINVKQMIDRIVGGSYASENCNVNKGGYANANTYQWYDINSPIYKDTLEKHNIWQESYDLAKKEYDESVQAKNQLFTAEEEALINFYDAIFSSIAEKGWTYNNQVNDTEYLNQMLQNNIYTMTTVDREAEFSDENNEYLWDNEYSTDIASNFTNIFFVNNTSAREEALIEYEHEKSIINEKESRIDTRMQNLQTEQAAINQMIQGIESVKNENIERTMNIFG